jgi:DNA-binding NarL/FixJ family response regulator
MLSAYDDYAYLAQALEVGVDGYLLKTASASELHDALRAVVDGVFVLDKALSARLARREVGLPVAQTGRGTPVLTPREAEVLCLLAQGKSNRQVAAHLALGLRTVEGHVPAVLAKLGTASRTEAVLYALEHHLVELSRHGRPARPR